MKKLTLFMMTLLLLPSILFSSQESNLTLKTIILPKNKSVKKKESTYEKFQRYFTQYDDSFIKNMFVYSLDIMMPDELLKASKDVVDYRDTHGYAKSNESFFKNARYRCVQHTSYYWVLLYARCHPHHKTSMEQVCVFTRYF